MKKEYSKNEVEEMRTRMAQRSMEEWDDSTIYDVAMDGCVGYRNMPDRECIEQYEDIWGEMEPHNPHVTLEIDEAGTVKKII